MPGTAHARSVVVTNDARRWAGRIGRAGYAARAAVYCLVAALALDAARRIDPAEPRGLVGALRELVARPGGRALIALLAVGLLAQALWRAVQAFSDVERPHGHPPRFTTRIGWSFIGVAYGALFVRAVRIVAEPHARGGDKRSLVARALGYQSGRVVAYGIAVGLLVFALVELVRGWRGSFLDDLDERALAGPRRRVMAVIGRVGVLGRALVFAAGGLLLARSAFAARADTIGVGDVLRHLLAGPFGQPLVAALAIGLFAYAALMAGEAAWRRNVRPKL
jgi:hypothetical protein